MSRYFLVILSALFFIGLLFPISGPLQAGSSVNSTASAKVEMLIPLYTYPNWYAGDKYVWDDVAAAASPQVPITAVINPNNGPDGGPPNADYEQGLADLHQGDVTILGYVSTDWGKRALETVKEDIDLYHKHFGVDGIFLDEATTGSNQLGYYQEVHDYIKNLNSEYQIVLNAGTHIDESYLSAPAGDTAIIFEDYSDKWPGYEPKPYVSHYSSSHFAMLAHGVPDAKTMRQHINKAVERNTRYVYLTDDTVDKDKNPWDTLPTFWQDEVECIAQINATGSCGQ